ncbi:hypothetical protein GCM10011393_04670 [Sphingopyxis bauzanensis]|nr:hypothetical protein GCM10011393_04670 [Sphingopyxis bauzanensis]
MAPPVASPAPMMTAAGLGICDAPLALDSNYDNHSDKRFLKTPEEAAVARKNTVIASEAKQTSVE